MSGLRLAAAALGLLLATSPASADILPTSNGGFSSSHSAYVAAAREDVWRELVRPEYWWTQTLSSDPANLRLDPRAGGCLCEEVPSPGGLRAGEAELARVVLVMPDEMLRMVGSLGPLQSEGVTGALTVTLTAEGEGTRIAWDYVAGGTARFDLEAMGVTVDRAQGGLLQALVAHIESLQGAEYLRRD
jgi:hypothetical protein